MNLSREWLQNLGLPDIDEFSKDVDNKPSRLNNVKICPSFNHLK